MTIQLGAKVKFTHYYTSCKDGVWVETDLKNGDATFAVGHTPNGDVDLQFEGDSVEKTYYQLKEVKNEKGIGFVIGVRNVAITKLLITDLDWNWQGEGYDVIYKQNKEMVKCAIVAYAMNKTHKVPLDRLEVIQ